MLLGYRLELDRFGGVGGVVVEYVEQYSRLGVIKMR